MAGTGPNYVVIPNDWDNLEYIISDLASRIINTDESFTDLLPLDGSRPMTGDLDMNGNDIVNAGDITATGLGTFGSVTSGLLTTTAGRIKNTTRYTTTQIIPITDDQIFCNTDGGAWTATLPAGAEGQSFRIINTGSSNNNLTIAPNGAEHLLGENSNFTLYDGEALIVTYNAADGWY